MNTTLSEVGRPPVINFGLELPRTVAEYALFLATEPLLHMAPSGDGHPVLVLPGFLADDRSTLALRCHLRGLRYPTHGWRLGRNIGPTKAIVDGMRRTLDTIAARHQRRVSVIGWSLGGVYARELARTGPDNIRQVITLGSPFRLTNVNQTRTGPIYEHYRRQHEQRYQLPMYTFVDEPLAMPSTAVYTRSDGIVAWQTSVQPVGPTSENIEVHGSHCGLGHNAAVVYAISDRLAQPEGSWHPFQPGAPLRYLYPRPVEG